ncbi:MAG TPA: hypothetical protein VLK82_09480 [Candidatus Tectomicrobia bacterium]|nr:hypothetical protein [Candidatus Tectomicrobia bacterium]
MTQICPIGRCHTHSQAIEALLALCCGVIGNQSITSRGQDIASSLVDDFAADHCHGHTQVAQAFDWHPAEDVSEDDEVGPHANPKATLGSFLK